MDIPVIYYTYNITTNSTSSTISNYTYAWNLWVIYLRSWSDILKYE
jgi:hypothetical protein